MKPMKKSTLFITLILLIVTGLGTYQFFMHLGAKKAQEQAAKKANTPTNPVLLETGPYMEEAFLAIATFWDDQELMKRASPYLQAIEAKQKQTPKLFELFKQIGDLKTNKGCVFLTQNNTDIPFTDPTDAPKINAAYSCSADFEKGDARIQFVISKDSGTWEISSYRVFSPFLEALVAKPTAEPEAPKKP